MTRLHRFIVAAIVTAVVVGLAGFAFAGAPALKSAKEGISHSISGAFAGLFSSAAGNSPVEISAELELKSISLGEPAETLSLEFSQGSSVLNINSEKIDLGEVGSGSVEAHNWSGSLTVGKSASLDAEADKITVNGVPVEPAAGRLHLQLENQAFDSVIINKIFLEKFSYTGSGALDINGGQLSASLNNETLMLKNFEGSIALTEGKIGLKGKADNVEVEGETLSADIG